MPDAFPTIKPKQTDPLTKAPKLTRTVDSNTLINELKKLKKVTVTLQKVAGGDDVTIEVLSTVDSEALEAAGGGGASSVEFEATVCVSGSPVTKTFLVAPD